MDDISQVARDAMIEIIRKGSSSPYLSPQASADMAWKFALEWERERRKAMREMTTETRSQIREQLYPCKP